MKVIKTKVSKWWLVVTTCAAIFNAAHSGFSQESKNYLETYKPVKLENYNLRFKDVRVDFRGQLGASFTDNVNFSESNKVEDFSFIAGTDIKAFYQPSRTTALNFDLFIGYQGFVETDELSTILIRPGSEFRIEKRFNQFKIAFYDTIGMQLDPTQRAYISGDAATLGTSTALEWRRLSNNVGLSLTWQPTRRFHTESAYEFQIDRTITDTFKELDFDRHVFKSGGYYDFSGRTQGGIEAQYAIREYTSSNLANSQNDSDSFQVGPTLSLLPGRNLKLKVGAAYATVDYDNTGSVADTENYDGFVFTASTQHDVSNNFSHTLEANKTIDDGFGTNFAEQTTVSYSLVTEIARGLSLTAGASYIWLETSGGIFAEDAQLFSARAGFLKQLTRKSTIEISYMFNQKDSEIIGRDFEQNLVSVLFNYDF